MTEAFSNYLFFLEFIKWNKTELSTQNSSNQVYRKRSINGIRSEAYLAYNVHTSKDMKLLTQLSFGLSHLKKHSFYHNFNNCVNHSAHVAWMLNQYLIFSCTSIITIH